MHTRSVLARGLVAKGVHHKAGRDGQGRMRHSRDKAGTLLQALRRSDSYNILPLAAIHARTHPSDPPHQSTRPPALTAGAARL